MRHFTAFDSSISLELLDLRLSPTALLVGGCPTPLIHSLEDLAADDSLPDPEPSPGPDPGMNTPVITPPVPPSGPIGPGNS